MINAIVNITYYSYCIYHYYPFVKDIVYPTTTFLTKKIIAQKSSATKIIYKLVNKKNYNKAVSLIKDNLS